MNIMNKKLSQQISGVMAEKIDSIHTTPVNIALIGDSGSGKSTLVNTLRGIPPTDSGAAKVGSVETTMKPVAYNHPHFPNVVFWDLPGVGTPKNPQSTYKKRMKLKTYDFFIVTLSNRFTENTLWLAKALTKLRKPFFFVRSKLDFEIAQRRKHNPAITDKQVVEELRGDIRKQSHELGEKSEVFIVSGELENSDRWDFPVLKRRILEVLPEVKRNTLTLSLGGYASDLIESKYQVMKKRVIYYSAASALGAVVPVPGLSIGVDIALILRMATEFAKAFGLTPEQVEGSYSWVATSAKVVGILGKTGAMLTTKALVKILTSHAASATAEELVRYVPIVGQGIAGGLSFAATYQSGVYLLKKLRKLAYEMAEQIIDQQTEDAVIPED